MQSQHWTMAIGLEHCHGTGMQSWESNRTRMQSQAKMWLQGWNTVTELEWNQEDRTVAMSGRARSEPGLELRQKEQNQNQEGKSGLNQNQKVIKANQCLGSDIQAKSRIKVQKTSRGRKRELGQGSLRLESTETFTKWEQNQSGKQQKRRQLEEINIRNHGHHFGIHMVNFVRRKNPLTWPGICIADGGVLGKGGQSLGFERKRQCDI